jgi:hypothetical protein
MNASSRLPKMDTFPRTQHHIQGASKVYGGTDPRFKLRETSMMRATRTGLDLHAIGARKGSVPCSPRPAFLGAELSLLGGRS